MCLGWSNDSIVCCLLWNNHFLKCEKDFLERESCPCGPTCLSLHTVGVRAATKGIFSTIICSGIPWLEIFVPGHFLLSLSKSLSLIKSYWKGLHCKWYFWIWFDFALQLPCFISIIETALVRLAYIVWNCVDTLSWRLSSLIFLVFRGRFTKYVECKLSCA